MTTITATTDSITVYLDLATGRVGGDISGQWHDGGDGWLDADDLGDDQYVELVVAIQAAIEDFWHALSGDVARALSLEGVEFTAAPNDDRTAVVVQATCEATESFDGDEVWAAVDAALAPMGLVFAHESGGVPDYLDGGVRRHGEYAWYGVRRKADA